MVSWSASVAEALVLLPVAFAASWLARATIRTSLRRAVRRAQRPQGSWRMRLDRLGDNGQADARKRQRADAVARMLGHMVTVGIFAVAALAALALLGVSPVVAISSAGFVGFAIAISGQHLANDVIAGTRALLEDRYAAGDEVILRIAGTDVRGTVDLIGSASIRLRTARRRDLARRSRLDRVGDQPVAAARRERHRDPGRRVGAGRSSAIAIDRLRSASNDVGLTGVVFLRDIETHEPEGSTADTVHGPGQVEPPADVARRGHRPRQAARLLT